MLHYYIITIIIIIIIHFITITNFGGRTGLKSGNVEYNL